MEEKGCGRDQSEMKTWLMPSRGSGVVFLCARDEGRGVEQRLPRGPAQHAQPLGHHLRHRHDPGVGLLLGPRVRTARQRRHPQPAHHPQVPQRSARRRQQVHARQPQQQRGQDQVSTDRS